MTHRLPVHLLLPACLLLMSSPTATADQAWEKQSSYPADASLNSVYFPTNEVGFTAGDDHILLQTIDGGTTWQQAPGITRDPAFWENPFNALHFLDDRRGWVIGNNNDAFRTTNGGQSWLQMVNFPAGSYYDLEFLDAQTGFAGGNGSVVRSRDGGVNWEVLTWWDGHGVVRGIDFRDPLNGVFSNNRIVSSSPYPNGIYLTSDGGDNWTSIYSGDAGLLTYLNADTILAVGPGFLMRSDDLGLNWTTIAWPWPEEGLGAWWPLTPDIIVGVGNLGTVYRSVDGGLSWSLVRPGPVQSGYGWQVQFTDARNGWISGPKGWLLKTSNAGESWTQVQSGLAVGWTDVEMADPLVGFAVGPTGEIVRTRNGGRLWEAGLLQDTGGFFAPTEDLESVSVLNRDFVVAGGAFGSVYKSADGGDSWDAIGYPAVPEMWVQKVDFVSEQIGWVAGQSSVTFGGMLLRTDDGGASWNHQSYGGWVIYDADFSDENTGWIVGGSDFAWKTTNGGWSWVPYDTPSSPGTPNTSVAFARDNPDVGWISAAFGFLIKTDDGGTTWRHQTLPNFPSREMAQDIQVIDQDHAILVSGPEGLVYSTSDGGGTWVKVNTGHTAFYGLGLSGVDVTADGRIWSCGAAGGIYASDPLQPGEIYFRHSDLVAGSVASLQVENAFAAEQVYFLYSLAGSGLGPIVNQLGGLQLDLLSPVVQLGTALSNAAGAAQFDASIPPNAPPLPVWTQAVIRRGANGALSVKSNFRSAVIQ